MLGLTLLLLSLMARPAASPGIRAASVWIAGHVGPKTLKMYHTENTNYIGWSMHALTMAQGGPARGSPKLRPQAFKLDRSLDLGYSRIKKKEKRTYAKLNASRPRTVVTRRNKPARARNWQPRTRVTSFRTNSHNHPVHKPRAQASSQRPQARGSWNQGTSAQA